MNDIKTQIKKLQVLDCQTHQEYGTQLNLICMDSKCSNYLEILCQECTILHPKHDQYYLQTFKKIMIQLSDHFLIQQQKQAENQQQNIDNEQLKKNPKIKQELLTLAKEFKILSQQCHEINNLISSTILSIFENPQEKINSFEECLNNINNLQSKEELQNILRQFKQNIRFNNNNVSIDFNMLDNYQWRTISNSFKREISKINSDFQEFQQKTVLAIREFQQNPLYILQQQQIPDVIENILKNTIPDYKQKSIEKITPKFSDQLHHSKCLIQENGKQIFHNSQSAWDFALFDDNLELYKNKIVYFSLSCSFTNGSHAGLGIIKIDGAISTKFYDSYNFSYRMYTKSMTNQVNDLEKGRNHDSFTLGGNETSIVFFMFNGYNGKFYLINQNDGKYVEFDPDLSQGSFTWFVACNVNQSGDTFKII